MYEPVQSNHWKYFFWCVHAHICGAGESNLVLAMPGKYTTTGPALARNSYIYFHYFIDKETGRGKELPKFSGLLVLASALRCADLGIMQKLQECLAM